MTFGRPRRTYQDGKRTIFWHNFTTQQCAELCVESKSTVQNRRASSVVRHSHHEHTGQVRLHLDIAVCVLVFANPLGVGLAGSDTRLFIRRFTRLSLCFSKKLENLAAAIALHVAYYNLCRRHSAHRVTPAMKAGITDHVWSLEELIG